MGNKQVRSRNWGVRTWGIEGYGYSVSGVGGRLYIFNGMKNDNNTYDQPFNLPKWITLA